MVSCRVCIPGKEKMSKKDITQKHYFEDNEKFADVMNAVHFQGRQVVKPSELKEVSASFLKADSQAVMEKIADVVRKQTKDGVVYAMYILENQEAVDYRMPVRVMLEEGLAYDKQVRDISKKNETVKSTNGEFLYKFLKTDRLTPVYTTVIYWGDKEWDGATSLRELIDFPEMDEELKQHMMELIPDYRIRVFDLNKETDFKAFQTNLKTVFEFYSHKNEKSALKDYMDTHKEEVEELDNESKFFLATMLGQKKLGNELLEQNTKKTEERSMCKAIDDMIEDGREEGRAEARAEAEVTIAALKKELEETKEKSNCKAIDDMIEDGREEGRAEARAEAEVTIAALKKELEETKEKSNCKAIDDMLADSYEEGRAEAEATIAALRQELEQEKEKNKLEIDRLKKKLAVYGLG